MRSNYFEGAEQKGTKLDELEKAIKNSRGHGVVISYMDNSGMKQKMYAEKGPLYVGSGFSRGKFYEIYRFIGSAINPDGSRGQDWKEIQGKFCEHTNICESIELIKTRINRHY